MLDSRIKSLNLVEENYRPILIAHKLLNDELDRLIEEGRKTNEVDVDDDDEDDYNENNLDEKFDEELPTFPDDDQQDLQNTIAL